MKPYIYKVDFLYNDNIEDFHTLTSSMPLEEEGIRDWFKVHIGEQVETYKIMEIWELEEKDEIKNIPYHLKEKIYPKD